MKSSSRLSSRQRFHAGVVAVGGAGIGWLALASTVDGLTICPFKLVTGVACPACGSTRAVLACFAGQNPFQYNPVGLVTFSAAVAGLFLLLQDMVTGSNRLRGLFERSEVVLRKPMIAACCSALLAANWWWTISKGL